MKHRICLLLFVVLSSSLAWGHGGGKDAIGGHYDRSTNTYHCHSEACEKARQSVDEATLNPSGEFSLVYDRAHWTHWADADGDCQDTRTEVLARDNLDGSSADACKIETGRWYDPYTDKTWTVASDLDIDHVVTLKWAHTHGAANWSREEKKNFANDLDNLLAVEDNTNQSKGWKGPVEWMPPNKSYHCQYLMKWNAIVEKYSLVYTEEELAWIADHECFTK